MGQIGDKLTVQIRKIDSNIEDIANLFYNIPKEGSNSTTRRKGKHNIYESSSDFEPQITFLKEFYASKLYNGIFNCVKRSLHILAVASGYKFDEDEIDDFNSEIGMNSFIDKSTDFENDERFKNNYLALRVKSSVSIVSHNTEKRPLSTVSALSKVTWSNERKVDESYLR